MFVYLLLSVQAALLVGFLQLESIIGKLKTDKYGDKILEVIRHDTVSEQLVEDATKEETCCKSRSSKRAKTKKNVVLLESSEEEEA